MVPMRRLKFCDFVDDIKYVGNHGNISEYDGMDYIVKASSLTPIFNITFIKLIHILQY